MPKTVSSRDLRDNLSDTLSRVAYSGERIIVLRHGKKAAALIPLDDLELLESVIEQLEDEIDIEEAKKALAEKGKPIPLDKLKRELDL